jgi:hypothetical protein
MQLFQKKPSLHDAIEGKVIYLLALVIFTQLSFPISENSTFGLILDQFFYVLMMFFGLLIAQESRRVASAMIVLAIIWMVVGVIYALNVTNIFTQLAAYASFALYQALLAWVLLRYIFVSRRVNRDILYAAVTVYILIGAIYVPVYGIIENTTFSLTGAGAFRDALIPAGQPVPWQSFLYYSYVTLTTMGYGDILPATMWARSAAISEAVIGVLYTAIIVSRLVALYISHNDESKAKPEA